MQKEIQDRVWKDLPKEFKENIVEKYKEALDEYDGSHDWSLDTIVLLEGLFGKHNLNG